MSLVAASAAAKPKTPVLILVDSKDDEGFVEALALQLPGDRVEVEPLSGAADAEVARARLESPESQVLVVVWLESLGDAGAGRRIHWWVRGAAVPRSAPIAAGAAGDRAGALHVADAYLDKLESASSAQAPLAQQDAPPPPDPGPWTGWLFAGAAARLAPEPVLLEGAPRLAAGATFQPGRSRWGFGLGWRGFFARTLPYPDVRARTESQAAFAEFEAFRSLGRWSLGGQLRVAAEHYSAAALSSRTAGDQETWVVSGTLAACALLEILPQLELAASVGAELTPAPAVLLADGVIQYERPFVAPLFTFGPRVVFGR